MQPEEFTWVDSVPVRPARRKRITIGEYEWVRTAPADGQPARLTARFWINSIEIEAILVEATTGGSTDQSTDSLQPRVRRRSLVPALCDGTGTGLVDVKATGR